MAITNDDIYEYLEHHGVKGMRWGVRKKYDGSKNQKTGTSELTTMGAFYVSSILAFAGYRTLDSGNARRLIGKGKAFITRNKEPWKKNPSLADSNLDVNGLINNVVRQINPHYGAPGTKMNCRRTTYAYEMRRRGFDVAATHAIMPIGGDSSGLYNVSHPNINLVSDTPIGQAYRIFRERNKTSKPFTDFAKTRSSYGEKMVSPHDIPKVLSTNPNGARGELTVGYKGGGIHSMAWEIVKNKPVVFDAQNGKIYQNQDILYKISPNIHTAAITRLDNIPLNTDFLRRWLKNA